ncbi:MAG: alpha-amylase [Spirochaetaceae bacterium]|nr:alpha-amylase [Spirochaetaceae bacterium]
MNEEEKILVVRLEGIEGEGGLVAKAGDRLMEFHVSREARDELGLEGSLFRSTGNVVLPDFAAARLLARRINERVDAALLPERTVRAGRLNAMALIDEILHDVARLYRERAAADAFAKALAAMEAELGKRETDALLLAFAKAFPPLAVYRRETTEKAWLEAARDGVPNRLLALEELLLLRLANENPAFGPYRFLFDDGSRPEGESPREGSLAARGDYLRAVAALEKSFVTQPSFGPDGEDLVTMLRAPAREAPYSLPGQLDYIRRRWGLLIGDKLLRLLGGLDLIREEEKPRFPGPGPTRAYAYRGMEAEYERFTEDRDWMPNVVMMAKSVLVWLHQLSVAYGRRIDRLDAIPDEELDLLATRGFNGLWLIGLWERSAASAEIKRRCGNPEAAASAYSLFDYEIAGELGGWPALESLRARAALRGIRMAADMVPNHVGIDSAWVRERPDLLMSSGSCPFPGYSFSGGDLSGDGRVEIRVEDHYYDRTDAAVVFQRRDRSSGRVDYVYHGNDGTGMAWNDTAQIDFLKPEAREAVRERILHVARNFPIIRFDAAMVLAKKSVRRLWYPEPGSGGDIPSRAEYARSQEDFDRAIPEEFWREVVDLCAREAPDTLLLAEAFWMMEGYFVRTLGMHRVYNSAFMNMLKREENRKYRETIKNTQEFDKDILKRFVNFMNNPDEETAVAQFGKGDKYFGVCTMMATMPGLPMFGHGQLEGFEEKYGMEYRRAYRDETPDAALVERHEREIFPLLKRRRLFSGVERFLLYDLVSDDGSVNDNAFVYSNGEGTERALVAYNNAYERASGRVRMSAPYAEKLPGGGKTQRSKGLAEALGLVAADDRFLVMRESRSGLWYLRRSREIEESGLALVLDGFQCQVFLDIFEVVDDERGTYRAVHDTLGGSGVPDLAEAVQDVVLKDLYAAFAALAAPGFFALAAKAVRGEEAAAAPLAAVQAGAPGTASAPVAEARLAPPPSKRRGAASPEAVRKAAAKELLATAAEPALAFYAVVRGLIREEAAEEGLPSGHAAALDPAAARALALAEDAAAAESARDRLLEGLAALAGLARPAASPAASPAEGRGEPAEGSLVADFLAAPHAAEIAAAYLVADGLKALAGRAAAGEEARRLVERLFLERKLREALRAAGTPVDVAHRAMSMAKAFLARSGKAHEAAAGATERGKLRAGAERAEAPPAVLALELFRAHAEDEEIRAVLGVNRFEGVDWFVKERFEELAAFGAIAAAAAPPPPGHKPSGKEAAARRLRAAEGTAAAFLAAEADSGYRLDRLGSALEAAAAKSGAGAERGAR